MSHTSGGRGDDGRIVTATTISKSTFGAHLHDPEDGALPGPDELLRLVDLFEKFDDDDHQRLADASQQLDLTRGEVLFGEGSDADACYVMLSGRIGISNRYSDGRESIVAMMLPGDLFGEMSLFDELGRSAEARALENCSTLRVPYDVLHNIWEDKPELLWSVVNLLSKRVRATDEALADSFFLDVTGRTAKHLLEMAGEDDVFVLPITQETLAGLVGASRERVNKAIGNFMRLGWIEASGTGYRILKRRELEIRSH